MRRRYREATGSAGLDLVVRRPGPTLWEAQSTVVVRVRVILTGGRRPGSGMWCLLLT